MPRPSLVAQPLFYALADMLAEIKAETPNNILVETIAAVSQSLVLWPTLRPFFRSVSRTSLLLGLSARASTSASTLSLATVRFVFWALPLLDNEPKHRKVLWPLLWQKCRLLSSPPPLLACKIEHQELLQRLLRPVCRSVPRPSAMLACCLELRLVDRLLFLGLYFW